MPKRLQKIIQSNQEAAEWAYQMAGKDGSSSRTWEEVEAALRMLDVTCPECGGHEFWCDKTDTGEPSGDCDNMPSMSYCYKECEHHISVAPCTCTDGKVNAYSQFMERFGG